MRRYIFPVIILFLAAVACQSVTTPAPPSEPGAVQGTQTVSAPQETDVPTGTSTPTAVAKGIIHVDTLEQEVYPFVENGKCSLAEAIIAANTAAPKDSCAAGVQGGSVIELMPGEYHFTQRDQTPPQFEWLVSIAEVGSALPALVFPLTIHGNGATLIRDESVEPFRFFELMNNSALTMDNVTLQNGDVGEEGWGGAIFASNASLHLTGVRFVNNRADNGGGIYFTFAALTIQDCEFTGNHAYFRGGGIFFDSARSSFNNTEFIGNTAGSQGAAISSESATIVIEESLFLKNVVKGTRGGALYLEHVNVTIARSEFYQNQSDWVGGAIYINNPVTSGTSDDEGNPLDQVDQSPMYIQLATMIPGYQATLEAHPSGVFQDFHEDMQIHDSCFANNIIVDEYEQNYTSAILAKAANAENNYFGNASGPSGGGPGTGDGVSRSVLFAPFLTEAPSHCDPELSVQVKENHNQ